MRLAARMLLIGMVAVLCAAPRRASAELPWLPSQAAITAPMHAPAVDFVVFGDARTNVDLATRVVEAIVEEAPDFVIATGDYVNDGGATDEWMAFRRVIQPLMQRMPLYAAIGNHDREGRGRRAQQFHDTFRAPTGPGGERYYYVDRGALRLIVLDSNAYASAEQTEWLANTLSEGAKAHRKLFVAMHHPVYSISLHGGHRVIRETWAPLFEHYGVQAVFSGHDHVYTRAEAGGVRYFVTGGAGAPLYGKSRNPSPLDVAAVKFNARVYHYLRVHVMQQLVEVSAVKLDGSILETVRWEVVPAAGGPDDRARTTVTVASPAEAARPSGALPRPARQAAPSTLWLLVGLVAVAYTSIRLGR